MVKQQQQKLRFMIGDHVIFKRKDSIGWHAGTVEELWYRNAKWPDHRPSSLYRVEQKSRLEMGQKDAMVLIEHDTDEYIRVMCHPQNPKVPLLSGDVPLPEPKDPLEYLYRPFPEDVVIQNFVALGRWKGGDVGEKVQVKVECVKDLGNQRQLVGKVASASASVSSSNSGKERPTFFLPNLNRNLQNEGLEDSCKEPGMMIVTYIAPRINFRRPIHELGRHNPEQLFHSIFPTESSVEELEETIRSLEIELSSCHQRLQLCKKLMNLGDALLLLFRPLQCTRNYERAQSCYRAAGFGLSEQDAKQPVGRAEGLPEAMCAYATMLHYSTERAVYGKIHNIDPASVPVAGYERPMLDTEQILFWAIENPVLEGNLSTTIYLLSCALEHGWFSWLAFCYGQALNEDGVEDKLRRFRSLRHPIDQRNIGTLQMAHRHHQIKNQVQERKMLAEFRPSYHGVPRPETILAFAPKALEILRNMPVHLHQRSAKLPSLPLSVDLKISFFELQVPSRPVCVLAICPSTLVVEILRIPDELQLHPFSEEVFQWIWLRIAFLIHLGLKKPNGSEGNGWHDPHWSRVRPKTFRLKNVGGDILFADFLQRKCFLLPGTQVALTEVDDLDSVDEMGFHNEDRRFHWAFIKFTIDQLQQEEIVKIRSPFFSKLSNSSGSILQMMRSSPLGTPREITSVLEKVDDIKARGNASVSGPGGYVKARDYYMTAIRELRTIIDPCMSSKAVYATMGTLLSNIAISGIEIAQTQTASYGTYTLKEVVEVCDVALTNPMIYQAMPDRILEKIRFRKALASSRQPETDPAFLKRTDEFCGDSPVLALDVNFNLKLFRQEEGGTATVDKIHFLLGMDVSKKESDKMCPNCCNDFSTVLRKKHIVKLQCGHLHCAKCFFQWKRVRDEGSNDMWCTMCRAPVPAADWDKALEEIVESCFDEKRVKSLPLDTPADRLEVFRALLVKHDLDLDDVSKALDDLLYLNNRGSLWQCEDLTPEEKQDIYTDARRPVMKLESKLEQLEGMLGTDTTEDEYITLQEKVEGVRKRLQYAKQNASDEIYSQINKTGSMGRVINRDGEFQLDFHSLTVSEAKEKFDQMVLPVLPVVKSFIIITGRGVHSSSNVSVLQKALQKYLTKKYHATIEHEVLKNNKGAIRICLKAESSLD